MKTNENTLQKKLVRSKGRIKKLTQIEHCLCRPQMYVGSIADRRTSTFLLNNNRTMFTKRPAEWNPAVLKLFDEIISNCIDESTKNQKLDTVKIELDRVDGRVTVEDNGGIPVTIDKEHDQYIPEMIFTELLCGSNFDDGDDSVTTGMNGLGSKLTNIFSTTFEVTTCDGKNKFYQKCENNLSKKSQPKITKSRKSGTTISYILDYDRFKANLDGDNYENLVKRVYDVAACNTHLKIYLNGERVKFASFKSYISKYTSDFVYAANDDWQIGVAGSNDGFQQVSFVNTTETFGGGQHVDYIADLVVSKIREFIKKKHKIDVKPSNIKNHLFLFINARIINPRYPSQTKETLITEVRDFGTSFEIPKKMIDDILKSDIVQSVLDWVDSKKRQEELAKLRKASKNNKRKKVAAHIRATGIGCHKTLYLFEGLSAIASFLDVRDRKTQGGFPLKGKPLNWRKAKSMADVANNVEIASIMAILGLEFGKPARNLNYDCIAFCTDADLDGAGSIVGLLNNFFSLWPELYDEERIRIIRSPVMVASKRGKESKYFYNLDDFENAKLDNSWTKKYKKGLGSLTLEEYETMIRNPVYDVLTLGQSGLDSLQMAFGDNVDLRKKWLGE